MRDVDERIDAVQKRAGRLRHRRGNSRALALVAVLMVLPLADLAGRHVAGSLGTSSTADYGLFGASSLFGASAGGYVLVAVAAAVVAVIVTVLLMVRRRRPPDDSDADGGNADE